MDDGGLEANVPATLTHEATTNPPISLGDLFDSNRDYWVAHHQRTSRRSLSEEMEIYSMLDVDLPSEEGAEVAIDDMAVKVLTLNAQSTQYIFVNALYCLPTGQR